jgi:hypothetical protein
MHDEKFRLLNQKIIKQHMQNGDHIHDGIDVLNIQLYEEIIIEI